MERTPETAVAEIRAWDTVDIHHLRDLLAELSDLCDDAQNLIDMSNLPSAPIPDDIDTGYPVWAVDTAGFALSARTRATSNIWTRFANTTTRSRRTRSGSPEEPAPASVGASQPQLNVMTMTLQDQLRLAVDALAGLSHEQIAAALSLGGGRQRINAMLTGRRPVRPKHIAQLAALLRSRAGEMLNVADALEETNEPAT